MIWRIIALAALLKTGKEKTKKTKKTKKKKKTKSISPAKDRGRVRGNKFQCFPDSPGNYSSHRVTLGSRPSFTREKKFNLKI